MKRNLCKTAVLPLLAAATAFLFILIQNVSAGLTEAGANPVPVTVSESPEAETEMIAERGQSLQGILEIRDAQDGELIGQFPLPEGGWFSIMFIHSVNKSPVTDCYEIEDGCIYAEKTIYYGFGAGVQTQLEEGQTLSYGDDGSMIISGIHQKISDMVCSIGTVSDHTLTVNGADPISLRELCGGKRVIRVTWKEES